jgi:hypothetical protein
MTKFSKRHYEAIAEVLGDGFPSEVVRTGKYRTKKKFLAYDAKQLVDRFSMMFKRDNPKFNREKFIDACGFTTGEDGLIE